MYTQEDYLDMHDRPAPAIHRIDFTTTALQLKAMGIGNICRYTFAALLKVGYNGCRLYERQVWSLTQFFSVDFSKSRIDVKECVFNKCTIKVCVSCS